MIFRSIVNDSMVYGGVDFLIKFISFLTFPLIAVALTPSGLGVLDLILTAVGLLGIVANCGLNNSVQRFYWDLDTTAEMRPRIVTSGLYTQFAFALVVVSLGLITIPWLIPFVEGAELPFTWITLVSALILVALNQILQFGLDVVRLHFSPRNFFTLSFVSRLFGIGFGLVAVVVLGLGIDGLLAAQVLGILLIVPLALWMIRRDFQLNGFDRKWFVELVQFGHPFIYAGLAYWLLTSMDRWMLASMTTTEEVGTYSVAIRFASLVLFVSSAFGQAWSAVAIKIRIDYPDQYREIFGSVLLLFVFAMLTAGGGVALFAGELITFIMPAEYTASSLPLSILCFAVVIQSTQQVTAIGISLEKKTYLLAKLAMLAAAVNFLMNYLLIPPFGAVGAACASLISYLVLTSSYLYFAQRLHPMNIEWNRLAALVGLGVVVAMVSVTCVATKFNTSTLLMKLVLATVCLLLGWQLLPRKTFILR